MMGAVFAIKGSKVQALYIENSEKTVNIERKERKREKKVYKLMQSFEPLNLFYISVSTMLQISS